MWVFPGTDEIKSVRMYQKAIIVTFNFTLPSYLSWTELKSKMNAFQIIGTFFGICSLFFTLAHLLWSIFMYLKKQGYSCLCEQACDCEDNYSDIEVDKVDMKETWV